MNFSSLHTNVAYYRDLRKAVSRTDLRKFRQMLKAYQLINSKQRTASAKFLELIIAYPRLKVNPI